MDRVLAPIVFACVLSTWLPDAVAQHRSTASWGDESNPRVTMIARPDDPAPSPSELYLLRPGHYVINPSDRPDYWSPHIRPFPDYSTQYQPRGLNRLPRQRIGGRTYGAAPSYAFGHGAGCGCAYCAPPYYGFADAAQAYNQGRYDADREYLWFIASQRAGRLINQSADFFDEGILLFRDGHYDRAAIKWLGAADINQANAATRLHAGHAMYALGKYADGVTLLARAFELSPILAYKSYDVRDEYGDHADFHRHLMALKAFVARQPADADALTMLGYILFYTEGPAASWKYLERASRLRPDDYFIPKLLTLARQASPEAHAAPLVEREVAPIEREVPTPDRAREIHEPREPSAPATAPRDRSVKLVRR